jgi:hypothetical protein
MSGLRVWASVSEHARVLAMPVRFLMLAASETDVAVGFAPDDPVAGNPHGRFRC